MIKTFTLNRGIISYLIQYKVKDGLIHSDDGPALIFNYSDYYFKNGVLYREDEAAIETFAGCGAGSKTFCQKLMPLVAVSEKDLLSCKSFKDLSDLIYRSIFIYRRGDEPAKISYLINYFRTADFQQRNKEESISEYWYQNNRLHRENGAAIIKKDLKGNIISELWYIEGKMISQT